MQDNVHLIGPSTPRRAVRSVEKEVGPAILAVQHVILIPFTHGISRRHIPLCLYLIILMTCATKIRRRALKTGVRPYRGNI